MKHTPIVGRPLTRVDAQSKVTGQAQYASDLSMDGMLFMKILFAERPHARILRVDTSEAESMPGVVAVLTAKDVPVNDYGLQIKDQPVFCGPGSSRPGADVVRFIGDQIAAVVAESEAAAAAALQKIRVDFEDLPVVTDPEAAMQPDAPRIHPEIGDSNICVHDKIRKGDVDAAMAQSEVIVEGEYHLPVQEHAYLQPEAGLAYLDEEGRITIAAAGQWAHAEREGIARALDLPEDRVRVILPAIGGAFGGREDLSVQVPLALAVWKLKRPVKIIWSRRESIIGHGKRHPMIIRSRWGATRDGKILAAETTIIGDAGAYMYTSNKVLGNSTITLTGPYDIPNVKADVYGVYTNNIPGAAFRGFGAPQALFMAESQMNKLADALNMDPVEIRLRNALTDDTPLDVGTPAPGPVTIRQVIESAAKTFGWRQTEDGWQAPTLTQPEKPWLKRGIGFAAGFKNVGFSFGYKENSWARVAIHGEETIESATLYIAGAEVGQGHHTAMPQIAAEVLGLPLEKIELVLSDTAFTGSSGSASASRLTVVAGQAVKGAAELALEKWQRGERPADAEYIWYAPKTTPMDKETGYSMPNFAYAYAAQAMEIEVDTETGLIRILRVVSADDVGRAINPVQVEGQIEGAVVQAQGYAMMEDFKTRDGYVLTDQLSTYLIPTIKDIPASVESVVLEIPDPVGPFGARGLGELPFLPVAPALTAALHNAVGVWLDEIPATPERVLKAMGKLSD